MADKLRKTYPVSISFSQGELPHYLKLTALGSQAEGGLRLLEYAIGDLWNSSGDSLINASSITENALMIPNIGRMLGASKNLSPRIPQLSSITRYRFDFTNYAGTYTAQLDFPVDPLTAAWSFTGTSAPGGAPETSLANVNATGKWYVDRISGKCTFYDYIRANWILTYKPTVYGDISETATHNIIPDLDTDASYAFQGLKIQYVNGTDNSQGYYVYLPPRGPLDERRISRSPQDDIHSPAHSGNFDATPTVLGSYSMWQADTVDATITAGLAEHYRYTLPAIITDNWSQSARLPDGLVYLWDTAGTGTILTGLVLTAENAASPRGWILIASGTALDTYLASSTGLSKYPVANLQSTSHAASLYPSGGLRLVTIGTSLAESLSALWGKFLDHNHSTRYNSYPDMLVSHQNLSDNYDADDDMSLMDSVFHPSALINDWHPQYLHRRGCSALTDRDKYKGGMLGDLFMCSAGSAGGTYDTLGASSRSIRFGSYASGPAIGYDNVEDTLAINNSRAGLRLVNANSVYISGPITNIIWCGIEPGTMDIDTWVFVAGGGVGYFLNNTLGAATLAFFINDWPEEMDLNTITIDIESGSATSFDIYFYKQTFAGGSNVITGTGYPSGVNKLTTEATTDQRQPIYTPTSSTGWTHSSDKLLVYLSNAPAGTKFYGVRINATWRSVNKWAPTPAF